MKSTLKTMTAVAALGVSALFAPKASALVYSPYDSVGSPALSVIDNVTGGYIASYWVSDGQPESPANSSPATIESFSEAITGLSLTPANNARCPGSGREGLGGLEGSNEKCVGNVFTVKLNDDAYLIFVYAAALALNAFDIELYDTEGGGLSHMDVYNGSPSPVPVPAALPLLLTGVAGMGVLARKRRKAK